MKIAKKQKLGLIDNYITIYRILYNCRKLIYSQNNSSDTLNKLQTLCDYTLDLKLKYEKAFQLLRMADNSFLLLKKQLNECMSQINKKSKTYNILTLTESIKVIEQDYQKLNL